jgi:hypothetical protein
MNALQNWRTEAKTLPGPSPITFDSRSNVAAIGTDSNRARRCKPRSIHANIGTTRSIFERMRGLHTARERVTRLE